VRTVAPHAPRQKSDRLKGVSSYTSNGNLSGSYWQGSVVADGKAYVASACPQCVPSSGGFEAFVCSDCSYAGWATVKHRSFHSIVSAPASVVSHSYLAALLASPRATTPTIVLKPRSLRPTVKTVAQAFRDVLDFGSDWRLVDEAIAENAATLLAIETASFDTQRPDELSIDEIVALSTNTEATTAEIANVRPAALAAFYAWADPSGHAFVAASDLAPSSTLQPTPSTKCKEVSITKALRSVLGYG
jgi:hypothetical protein